MKKILLPIMMLFLMLFLTSCEAGSFLDTVYEAEYYAYENKTYISKSENLSATNENPDLKAYHTMTFTTNNTDEIKNKEISYVSGSFHINCFNQTKFHIQLKWTQGFWYKDKIFINEDFIVNPEDTILEYEVDLYDDNRTEQGLKIPNNNEATITISITAYVDDKEIKDFEIAFKDIEFIIGEHDEVIEEDESLKNN